MSVDPDLLLEAYRDGTLTVDEAAALATALRDDAGLRERLAFAGLLAQALDPADDAALTRSVLARIEAEESPSRMVRAVRRAIALRRRMPAWPLAAAALVLLGLSAWLLLSAPASVCIVTAGTAVAQRGGDRLEAGPGLPLRAGDRLTAGSGLGLRWPDGSTVTLGGQAQADITDGTLRLVRGGLEAVIAAQAPGRDFTITTPDALVTVLGTRFRLEVADAGTHCDLHAGRVRLTRLADGRSLHLAAGEGALVAPDAPLAAWRPLFPGTGLAGWRPQHGRWTNADGLVAGSASGSGKARLLSEHAFADLELTCRLRLAGATVAEIQLGDYNWFFAIPAQPGAWVAVHLRQQDGRPTCTADGVPLAVQAGDGAPPRPGSLSFYVRGGALELADARILILESP
jgi:ferric-dicitrate binding protein FerR (iron transport regulator)